MRLEMCQNLYRDAIFSRVYGALATVTTVSFLLSLCVLFPLGASIANAAPGVVVPNLLLAKLAQGQSIDLLVEYDSSNIESEIRDIRRVHHLKHDDAGLLDLRHQRYRTLKADVEQMLSNHQITRLVEYSHLPLSYLRFDSSAGLQAFLAQAQVKAVYENIELQPVLTQSLAIISQPPVASEIQAGIGTTVAVIDNGINYGLSAFGSCTAPAVPASCKVVVSESFDSGGSDHAHGTNVSAIVVGVAPAAKIAMLDVFSSTGASASNILSAINWAIVNAVTYNIAAINMSLGDTARNTTPCTSGNPFYTAISNAMSAGIQVVVAAGNNGYADGLSNPACTPGVISVGAVYDANVGGITWTGICTDATTTANKIACFSNSADFLTLLAPGAMITAAGYTQGGTSQAAPHAAGAIATLASLYPEDTLSKIRTRITASGSPITDARNGISFPRLDLLSAVRPVNDAIENRSTLTDPTGQLTTSNVMASKQSGEPSHAGNGGGRSLWWAWTVPAAGQVTLDTHGSGIDTLLAVYTGSSMNSLTEIAANDNDGSAGGQSGLLFQASGGTTYTLVIDGKNAQQGPLSLQWGLNTNARADLVLALSGPNYVDAQSEASFIVNVSNAGPQAATNALVSLQLPDGVIVVNSPENCTVTLNMLNCTLGNILPNEAVTLSILLYWPAASSSENLLASVQSDLPDSDTTTNSGSILVTILSADTDIPFLPAWALMLAFMVLARTGYRHSRSK